MRIVCDVPPIIQYKESIFGYQNYVILFRYSCIDLSGIICGHVHVCFHQYIIVFHIPTHIHTNYIHCSNLLVKIIIYFTQTLYYYAGVGDVWGLAVCVWQGCQVQFVQACRGDGVYNIGRGWTDTRKSSNRCGGSSGGCLWNKSQFNIYFLRT